MVESNANYSKLPQEHNPVGYEYPTDYHQPESHLPQGDSQVLPPPNKHTGNLHVFRMKNGKPVLSLGPGCNYNVDIVPLIWFVGEVLLFGWNNSVDVSNSYKHTRYRINTIGDFLLLTVVFYHTALTLHNPGYIRSVETDKIHEAMQNPM